MEPNEMNAFLLEDRSHTSSILQQSAVHNTQATIHDDSESNKIGNSDSRKLLPVCRNRLHGVSEGVCNSNSANQDSVSAAEGI